MQTQKKPLITKQYNCIPWYYDYCATGLTKNQSTQASSCFAEDGRSTIFRSESSR